jgi:hypothetical protein
VRRAPAAGYATPMDDEQTTPQAEPGTGENPDVGGIGDGPGSFGDGPEGDAHDAGGRAHTGLDEGHPAGDGPRSDRDVGGPTAAEDAEPQPGTEPGAHGDIQTKGMPPHS